MWAMVCQRAAHKLMSKKDKIFEDKVDIVTINTLSLVSVSVTILKAETIVLRHIEV